uniref:Putative secreted protein n=1 Tax=Anopheles marajoara TaxID=58244 RepID=A0A2M4CE41_9DIPT
MYKSLPVVVVSIRLLSLTALRLLWGVSIINHPFSERSEQLDCLLHAWIYIYKFSTPKLTQRGGTVRDTEV